MAFWFLGIFYIVASLFAFFFPNELCFALSYGVRFFPSFIPLPDGGADKFWSIFAAAGAMLLASLSFLSATQPKNTTYTLIHLFAKIIVVAGFLHLYLDEKQYLAYLLVTLIESAIAIFLTVHLLMTAAWHAQTKLRARGGST
ncbi:hypothetical protein K2X30_04240 [bacterium]|jgi:intracellular septation protein A|nr:hypothetical protein [bacterium]